MSADSFPAPAGSVREREIPRRRVEAASRARRLRLSWPVVLGALIVLTGVSVWLRTRALHQYLWIDEGISVGIASHPLSAIPGLMRQDGSPPLYYLLLHVWMSVFGRSEVATHELSLLFSLLSIPVAYWAGATLFERRAGLICAGLAAGVPYLTRYATETRMYSLMVVLSIIVAASFVHAFVRRRRRYLPLFSVSLAAAAYTHNWGLFLGFMTGVAYLWCLWRSPAPRRALWRDGVIAFGLVVILFAPWLPTVAFQAQHTGAPWDSRPVLWSFTQALYYLVGGRGSAMVILLAGGTGLVAILGASAALVPRAERRSASARVLALVRRPLSTPSDELAWPRLAVEALFIMGIGTMVFAFAYSKINTAWAVRYLAAVLGPLLLLAGLGLSRARRLGLVGLVLLAAFWILDPISHGVNSKSNVRAVAAQVSHELGSNALVLSAQPEDVPVLDYYLPSVKHWGTPLGPVADPRVTDWRDALERFERSSVGTVLEPMIRSLAPGEKVMLVMPVHSAKAPPYLKLVSQAAERWSYFLAHDPNLKPVGSSAAYAHETGVAVRAFVYERR